MAKQDFKLDGEYQDAFQSKVENAVEWLGNKENRKKQNNILWLLVVLIGLAFAYQSYTQGEKSVEVAYRESLGEALNLNYQGKYDESKVKLETLLSDQTVKGQIRAKANLLLGEVFYYQGKYDEASDAYTQAITESSGLEIIESAAEHGLAASMIQKGDFKAGAVALEAFVEKWSVRDASFSPFVSEGKEDKVVTIPDALIQLSLCYKKLGDTEKAKMNAEKVITRYPETRQVNIAQKILTTL